MNALEPKIRHYLKIIWPYLVLLVIVWMPLFGNLDTLTIRLWDEARLAMNAYNMHLSHNFLVPEMNGQPDMWNTKPPLMIWLQVFFMNMFGVNEYAVRLPSALASLGVCLAIMAFSIKYFKSKWLGIVIVLVLVSSSGYVREHGVRTGDYDALLTLFATISNLFLFTFLENKKTKYLYLFFIALALGVLTKGITILIFLPAWLFYVVWNNQFGFLLRYKQVYLGATVFLAITLGYYLLREYYNPGYLEAVYNNELGGRFIEVKEGHGRPFLWYLDNFNRYRFKPWLIWFLGSMIYFFYTENTRVKKMGLFIMITSLGFFLVISLSQTKIDWYDMPLYPLMSVGVGLFLYAIINQIKIFIQNKDYKYKILPYLFVFAIFYLPYKNVFTSVNASIEWRAEYDMSQYLRAGLSGQNNLKNNIVITDGFYDYTQPGYSINNLFYIRLLNEKGLHVQHKPKDDLLKGDIVLTHETKTKQYLDKNYRYRVLDKYKSLIKYEIYGRKK